MECCLCIIGMIREPAALLDHIQNAIALHSGVKLAKLGYGSRVILIFKVIKSQQKACFCPDLCVAGSFRERRNRLSKLPLTGKREAQIVLDPAIVRKSSCGCCQLRKRRVYLPGRERPAGRIVYLFGTLSQPNRLLAQTRQREQQQRKEDASRRTNADRIVWSSRLSLQSLARSSVNQRFCQRR